MEEGLAITSLFDPGRSARQSRDELRSVRIPDESQLRVQLQRLVQTGELTPAQAETYLQEQTAYNQIGEDPRLRADQIDVLSAFDDQIAQGGLDARARAGINDVQSEIGTQARGAREALQQRAASLGLANSDLALTQQAISDQSAATRGAAAGINIAALAEERRQQALRDKASLAANLRGADYQQAANAAAAQDAINRFNAQNKQDTANRNTQATNVARAQNLSERQRVADANVGLGNQQEQVNRRLPLDLYSAKLGKAQNIAGTYAQQGAAEAARDDKLLQLAGNAASAFALSDERSKEEVEPIDSRSMLEGLSGVTFRYRDHANGDGKRSGVMAQDLERVQPSAVSEGPDGMKQIDFGQLGNFMLGNLVDVSERLKAVERRK